MIAYHGTTRENKQAILEQGFRIRRYQNQVSNDLGDGIYFYVDSMYETHPKQMAVNFVMDYRQCPREDIRVLKVNVSDDAQLINLEQQEWRICLDQFRNQNLERIERELSEYSPGNGLKKRGNIDGLVIQLFLMYLKRHGKIQHIDGVEKDTFTKFPSLSQYKLSHFPNGTELCLYNPKRINQDEIEVQSLT
jgi:hypothetical protein